LFGRRFEILTAEPGMDRWTQRVAHDMCWVLLIFRIR